MIEYTVNVNTDGTTFWYLNGHLHREDGPAIETSKGSKEWYLNGQRHREDGPARELSNGYKSWWVNGKLHKVDGAARQYSNGDKEWYLNGKQLTKEEFNDRTNPTEMTLDELEDKLGYKISVVGE